MAKSKRTTRPPVNQSIPQAKRKPAVGRVDPPAGKFASEDEANLYDDYGRKRLYRPGPKPIADLVSRLLTRTGYANVQAKAELQEVWKAAAGAAIAKNTRPGSIQRGTWEIIVRSSALLQELSFQQTTILRAVQQAVPQHKIMKLRFKVGPIE